jgi:hypothetical protein
MIVKSNLFKYIATFHLSYKSLSSKITYLFNKNEQVEDAVELFNNHNEDYKIFVNLEPVNTTLTLKSLTLEKYYPELRTKDDFTKYAEDKLLPILNKIIFSYSNCPQGVNYTRTSRIPDYDSRFAVTTTLIITGECLSTTNYFDRLEYENICKDTINILDEYIADYLLIKKLHDPDLRLISAYRLYELIGQSISTNNRKYDASQAYYEDNTSQRILELEYLAIATRNLVAHGSANSDKTGERKTVEALNVALSTPSATCHKFDRKDKKHMELVERSAAKILYAIKNYITVELNQK